MSNAAGSITLYGLLSNSVAKFPANSSGSSRTLNGPWQSGNNVTTGNYTGVTDIATLTSSVNIVGFVDGQNRAKYFYSSLGKASGIQASGSAVTNLPTIAGVPTQLPPGNWVQLGSANASFVAVNVQQDTSGNYFGAQLFFQVTPAAGSPDAGSPMYYTLDQYGLLIVDSSVVEWA